MAYAHPSHIPSDSLVTGNDRIMATVKTGQLTTDRLFGVAGLFAPTKHDRSLVQSSRVSLLVDEQWHAPLDADEQSAIRSRGYEAGTNVIVVRWQAGPIEVEDRYFVPPDVDLLTQRIRVRNTSDQVRQVRLFAVLCPHLGGGAAYRKGVCRRAAYDPRMGSALVEDHQGALLVYAFTPLATAWQVGQVCGPSDVHYDLEDRRLSNVALQQDAVAHLALELDLGALAAGEQREADLVMGRFSDHATAEATLTSFRERAVHALTDVRNAWSRWLAAGEPAIRIPSFEPRLADLDRTSRIMLKTHQSDRGVIVVGSTASDYQGAVSARNGCFCLRALDRLGYHAQAAAGLEYFLNFKLGDERFCSPDENDQLGTILHVYRIHHDLTDDRPFLARNYAGLCHFANALIALIDPRRNLIYSERAIHELVAIERGYETYVNVMAFRGLADAAHLAAEMAQQEDAARFEQHADRLRRAILAELFCPREQTFTKRIYQGQRVNLPAVSMLTPALFGVLDARDSRVDSTLRFVLHHLWDQTMGGLYRYPLHLQPWDEIPYGGPWITYTCWLARVYLLRGELAEAHRCLQWVIDHAPRDSNLLPEHFSIAHLGQRGFHRVYYEPVLAEAWATAEFLVTAMDYQQASARAAFPQLVTTPKETVSCGTSV